MKNVLVTGASGYVGTQLIKKLKDPAHKYHDQVEEIVALDIKDPIEKVEGVHYFNCDIRDKSIDNIVKKYKVDSIIHLACVVTPSKTMTRDLMYSIDVDGTRNILEICVANDVQRISIASSGAAYGYYADNPDWLSESDQVRGNYEFAYSYHKRIVENDLAHYRDIAPNLKQFVFRIGTVLGKTTNNQITDLFKKPFVLGIHGSDSPFVFIWDEDLVNIFCESLFSDRPGIYNVAGDGAMKIDDIAKRLNKKCIKIPAGFVQAGLSLLQKAKLSQYGPEQIDFLRFRPVLDNKRLKSDFQYTPQRSSAEVFDYYLENRVF